MFASEITILEGIPRTRFRVVAPPSAFTGTQPTDASSLPWLLGVVITRSVPGVLTRKHHSSSDIGWSVRCRLSTDSRWTTSSGSADQQRNEPPQNASVPPIPIKSTATLTNGTRAASTRHLVVPARLRVLTQTVQTIGTVAKQAMGNVSPPIRPSRAQPEEPTPIMPINATGIPTSPTGIQMTDARMGMSGPASVESTWEIVMPAKYSQHFYPSRISPLSPTSGVLVPHLSRRYGASCAVTVRMFAGRQWGGWIELKGSR